MLLLSVLGTSQAFRFPFARRSNLSGKNSVIVERYEAIRDVLANAPQDFQDLYFLDPWTVKFTGPGGKPKQIKPRIIVNYAPLTSRNLPSYLQQQKGPSKEKEGRRFQPLVVAAAIAFFAAIAFRPAIARAHYSPFFLDPATLTYEIPHMIIHDQAKTSKIIAGFQGIGSIVGLFASALLVGVALAFSTLDGVEYWNQIWSKIRETKDGELSSDEATSQGAAERSSWTKFTQKLNLTAGLDKDESRADRKVTQKQRELHQQEVPLANIHDQTVPYLDSLKASSAHEEIKHDPQKTYLDSLSDSEGDYAFKLNESVRQSENAHHIEQPIHPTSATTTTSQTKSIDTELLEHEAMSDDFEESMREAAELKSRELSKTDWLRNNLG